jgi:collagen type IX alpha
MKADTAGISTAGLCDKFNEGVPRIFDFISKLKLDLSGMHYSGITKVRGSNRLQTAYRLEKGTGVTLSTKYSNYFE